ncbi:MAG: cytidylate kinase-like family protein [Holophaga sp.]|jgi:cytidylate kinase
MHTDSATGSYADKLPLDQCNAYVHAQLEFRESHAAVPNPHAPGPAITISHLAGSGAHEIAIRLTGFLQVSEPDGPVPWTVFDRNLVEKVLEDHHLSQTLAKFIPEDRRNYIQDAMTEMVGVIPPSWDTVPQIASTVLHLADAGHVILVGRGANFITSRVPNVFHVRLIASLPKRIERIQRLHNLTAQEAAEWIKKEDHARGRYVKSHFHVGINDDLLYHLIINTDRVPCAEAVQLIAHGMRLCTGIAERTE